MTPLMLALVATLAQTPEPPPRPFVPTPEEEKLLISIVPWQNSGTARLGGYYYDLGVSHTLGGGLLHSAHTGGVPLSGFRLHERHGPLGDMAQYVFNSVLWLINAAAVAGAHTESTTDDSNVIYEETYNAEKRGYEKRAVGGYYVTTYTVTISEDEFNRKTRMFEAGSSDDVWFDLTVYASNLAWAPRLGGAGGNGFDFAFGGDGVVGNLFQLPVVLDLGLQIAQIDSLPSKTGGTPLRFAAFGPVVRLAVPLGRHLTVGGELDLNLLAFEYLFRGFDTVKAEGKLLSIPLKLTAETGLLDRIYLRGTAIVGGVAVDQGALGAQLELGIRM